MREAEQAALRLDDKDGYAVGNGDGEQHVAAWRDQGVGSADDAEAGVERCIQTGHAVAVNLAAAGDRSEPRGPA